MADTQSIQVAIGDKQRQIAEYQAALADAIATGGNPYAVVGFQQRIATLEAAVIALQAELAAASATAAVPTASTGQVVKDDGTASTQNPAQPTSVVTAEGRINPANIESGTNAPTRTLQQTQGTPQSPPVDYVNQQGGEGGYSAPPNATNVAAPITNPGVGAARDDNTAPTTNATQQVVNASFSQKIIPQPNVLDAYTSYTYGLSWYLLSPSQYKDFGLGKRNVATWSRLAQSGGASSIGRDDFFKLDYYIDNLNIETNCPLKGTGLAHSALTLDFTVTEPNGITLLKNLVDAVKAVYKKDKVTDNPAYTMAFYCMVIRFYGYDASGNLANPIRGQGLVGYPNQTDTKAVVEKFYPFTMSDFKFRVANKQIEYQIKGKPVGQFTALSQDRGSIPFQFQLAGETVSDILIGKAVGTVYPSTPATEGRVDSPQPVTSAPAPAPATSVNDITASAGVDINGNFTGETASPFSVAAA